ncbi:MAG: aminotransferase class III-fold pyridoxal phosphate-dependent enzyme [Bacillota bacterium]
MSEILERFVNEHPTSQRLYEGACEVLPSGLTHDNRRMTPFPVYMDTARGARKWDVDGNEYVDFVMGHGSLILGHLDEDVVAAVKEQMDRGTHLGASHEKEMRWAEKVTQMVPGADRVRFTSSGTEATMLALRLARTYTGNEKIVRFYGNFHGWHDYLISGNKPPFSLPSSTGLPQEMGELAINLRAGDIEAVRAVLNQEEVAAVIMEPTGGTQGKAPVAPEFVRELRDLTIRRGVLLIFDEVVTGFRVSPQGAAGQLGVYPDLTALGKIVAGGLPGGAVTGRGSVMSALEFSGDAGRDRYSRVAHPGTFNANPLSASAALASLPKLEDGSAQEHCERLADRFRGGANQLLEERGISGCVYGVSSMIHLAVGADIPRVSHPNELVNYDPTTLIKGMGEKLLPFRRATINRGIDFMGPTGFTSTAHSEEDIDIALEAFAGALDDLGAEGIL